MSNSREVEPSTSSSTNKKAPRKPEKCNINCEESMFSLVAQPITLPPHLRKSITLSPIYSPLNKGSYMEQCFDDVKYLAEGSFGMVFEARSKDDGNLYAVKQFKKRFASKIQRNLRLEEIHRYASIPRNEFCVELIRAWEENAYLFVQMELCPVTLKQFMTKNRLVEDTLWKILLDLLLALQHLHSNNFIHLDIKPENILVSPDHVFKLADFGLMLDLSKGPISDADEGDSRYLAPEVLRGVFTPAADIFSLGISMFEVGSCLQLPSHGQFWQELRRGVLPYCRFSCQSKELFELIRVMMLPVPEDRPSVDKLLKYKKFAEMRRSNPVQVFLCQMAARMKTFYVYGKIVVVNCGLRVLKPFAMRICTFVWKKNKNVEEDENELKKIGHCKAKPCSCRRETEISSTPGVSRAGTEEEASFFRARLAACKKRLNFDDEPNNNETGNVLEASPDRQEESNGSNDGAINVLHSPKRRRLFD